MHVSKNPWSTDSRALFEQALDRLNNGRFREAQQKLESLLGIVGDDATLFNALGVVFYQLMRYDRAIEQFQNARKIIPDSSDIVCNLANCYQDSGNEQQAIHYYRKAISMDDRSAKAYYGLGVVLLNQGEKEQAGRAFDQALKINPALIEVHQHRVKLKRYTKSDRAELVGLQNQLQQLPENSESAMNLNYALGKAFDDVGDYETAFGHFQAANRVKKTQLTFDPEAHGRLVDGLIAHFSSDYFKTAFTVGSDDSTPVFVVGMPRSGTSLVEQIIASHPEAEGAGELDHFHRTVKMLPILMGGSHNPYPDCLARLNQGVINRLARDYLQVLDGLFPNANRVVNKMPTDFLHLGLIYTLFPKATLIHCARNPRDTALSIYFQNFSAGQNYAASRSQIVEYYQQYQRVMDHWQSVIPNLLTVRYEALTKKPEVVIRQIIQHADLDWDPVCLNFFETKRSIATASNWQVRQKIHSRSVERWKKYQPFLGPLSTLSLA
ncbi:MAG: sulfotransferase [Magnetococcales bacterium]|nr:sulfotransferase [Magnetococcales bacterium]